MAISALPLASQVFAAQTEEYEYIIVGAGAGGGPLAVNLAKQGFSVLLIDAGSDELPMSAQIPAYHTIAAEDPKISWEFFVNHYAQAHKHGKWQERAENSGVLYPRSSVIGGCTAHNAMICLYPDHDDWDRIFKLTGRMDASWKSSAMRNLFLKKIENGDYFTDPHKGWHHLNMSPISLLKGDSALQNILLKTATEKHFLFDEIAHAVENNQPWHLDGFLDANRDHHLEDEGLLRMPMSTYLGKRYGVYDYVMETKRTHSNLKVMPHTLVKKVVFEKTPQGLKAIGVEALKGANLYQAHGSYNKNQAGKEVFIKAKREVILAGGAFNSPQLLMLSGIGPADQYDSLTPGAPVKGRPHMILDGVGKNLQDRYEVTVVTELDKDFELLKECEFDTDFSRPTKDPCLKKWMNESTRQDSLYATNGVLTTIKMRSSVCQEGKTDLILFGVPGHFSGYYPGFSKEAFNYKNRFTWAILKGHTRNRQGRVTLKSDNCREMPQIDFNYFSGEGADEDMQAVYEGVDRVRSLNRNIFGAAEDVGRTVESHPGKGEIYPSNYYETEEGLKNWIAKEAWGHHASCSNKMGIHPKDGSVVDLNFKVHGTLNLRVVDASVFPEIPGLFIVTPIYMIAEKASEAIIASHHARKV